MKQMQVTVTGQQGIGKTKALEAIKAALVLAGYRLIAEDEEDHWVLFEEKE